MGKQAARQTDKWEVEKEAANNTKEKREHDEKKPEAFEGYKK